MGLISKIFGKNNPKEVPQELTEASSPTESPTSTGRSEPVVSRSMPSQKSYARQEQEMPVTPKYGLKQAEGAEEAERRAKAAEARVAVKPIKLNLPKDASLQEEIFATFASGEKRRAVNMIVDHLKQSHGKIKLEDTKPFWYMLLDSYEALDDQAAFEKAALMFSSLFKMSAPSWEINKVEKKPETSSSSVILGRHVLVMEGRPSLANTQKVKDFILASRQQKACRLDLSRAKMGGEAFSGLELDVKILLALMRKLRKYHVEALLMGENQVVEEIREAIQKQWRGEEAHLLWELLLEFLQWRGQEEAFNMTAVEFARRFGWSAPGYEPNQVVALPPTEKTQKTTHSALIWTGDWNEEMLQHVLPDIEQKLLNEGEVVLKLKSLRSFSFEAASLLSMAIANWNVSPEKVQIDEPSSLIEGLFDITGVSAQVKIKPRKR